MQECKDSCPKLNRQPGPSLQSDKPARSSSHTVQPEDLNGSLRTARKSVTINDRRGSPQIQKPAQIIRRAFATDEVLDSPSTRSSERPANSTETETRQQPEARGSPKRKGASSTNQREMPERVKSSPQNREDAAWDSARHNPCASSCPTAKARDRGARRAQLRQERLDDYLLTKGFSYFDDICTCSLKCLMAQLKRDKFVVDVVKSACFFTLGLKLCEELDAWNIIG